jgi:hypothetical protein
MALSGWAVVDDSRSLVFDDQSRLVARTATDNLDLYFFGYGHDYISCLQDFQKVSGQTPLIPRWLLGNWWSRYWAYRQDELQGLIEDFAAHQVPLAVCIVDMDWHITQTGNQSVGWTGYTWDRNLFPQPQAFIDWLHAQGLRTALNLHPADGIFPHEEQYGAMAAAVGIDPETMEPVPFDIANRQFGAAYFELLHHPAEANGVDFWWLDWQQGTQSKMKGLDPLWWLNHLHFYDLGRDGRWTQAAVYLLALGWPGQPSLPDRILRRHDRKLGLAGIIALFHGYGRQCRLWLVEPRHRRPYVGRRRSRALRALGPVRRLQSLPAPAQFQFALLRTEAVGLGPGRRGRDA